MTDTKSALTGSPAGMRLIAQMTIFNSGNPERLRGFITESYANGALETQSAEERVQAGQADFTQTGGLRVEAVRETAYTRVVVELRARDEERLYRGEMVVSEDYPHKILNYQLTALE